MSAVTAVPIRPIARGSVLKLWLALARAGRRRRRPRLVRHRAAAGAITLDSGVRYRVIRARAPGRRSPRRRRRAALQASRERRRRAGHPGQRPIAASRSSRRPTDVFPGFGEGLQLMRAGGDYRLWLPPGIGTCRARSPPAAPFGAGRHAGVRDPGPADRRRPWRPRSSSSDAADAAAPAAAAAEQPGSSSSSQAAAPPDPHGGTHAAGGALRRSFDAADQARACAGTRSGACAAAARPRSPPPRRRRPPGFGPRPSLRPPPRHRPRRRRTSARARS